MALSLGLDVEQVRQFVVRPTLKELSLWTPAAENLVLGTGLTESRLRYVKQVGGGPALGLWQMEPATHDDLWVNWLHYNDVLADKILCMAGDIVGGFPPATELVTNLRYACALCRIHYRRVKEALPPNSPVALASYWKRHYNTHLGAGTVEKAMPYFAIACQGA